MFSPHLPAALRAALSRAPLSLTPSASHGADITLASINTSILLLLPQQAPQLIARIDQLLLQRTSVVVLVLEDGHDNGNAWAQLQVQLHATFAEAVMVLPAAGAAEVAAVVGGLLRGGREVMGWRRSGESGTGSMLRVMGVSAHGRFSRNPPPFFFGMHKADGRKAASVVQDVFGSLKEFVEAIESGEDVKGLEEREVQVVREFLESEGVVEGGGDGI
ncbi:hypothetical protein FN846DRAFT_329465 [Sphaerosporella brunnea]|uniref:Uncharacterized protein n=1 Tax=Sphaerosporella brunnea TaxID=1250544 RepID=A0A5J5EKT0_9PEZI|nr:hypothetical protein FN846DRAFT_329465 [Sphaerosporella brunnea]